VASKKEVAEDYGFVMALFNSSQELKKLFNTAIKKGYTADKFQAELRDTKWWKTRSQDERDFLTLKYGDPATANAKLSAAKISARQLGNSMGIQETAFTKDKMDQVAYNMVAKGWTESQARYYLGQYVTFQNDNRQGEGGETIDKLHALSYSMGIKMSGSWYADSARAIVRGVATEQDMEDKIRKQAKALFPQWSKQIDAGQSVSDLASPYFQSMANILELPAGSINLYDPTVRKALQYKDKTGVNTVKPIWQFENDLRKDPRWNKTQNAQDSMMQTAHKVLADFGVAY
jgi:hypothetical protein